MSRLKRVPVGGIIVVGGFFFVLIATLFALYVAVARDKSSSQQGLFDLWLAAFIVTHRLEVPAGCVPPSYPVGSEDHRRQTGEESQTTMFLCLRAWVQGCDRFSLFNTCFEVVWPAEVKAVPGPLDFLAEAHRAPCRVVMPDVAGRWIRRWRETGYFPQDVIEGQAPLLQKPQDGCSDSHTYVMKVRPLPPRSD